MFKLLGSMFVALVLITPTFATHCNQRVVQRVVVNDYDYVNQVQAVVLVPHVKLQQEYIVQNLDYNPKVVVRERVIERVKSQPVREVTKVVASVPVNVIERLRDRPRLRVRQKVVEKQVIVQEVPKIKSRNIVRERILNNGY